MSKTINWGIIGLGNISHVFAEAIAKTQGAKLLAVASRTKQKAEEFAKKHNVDKAYEGYANLANDKDIDVVYIATPHGLHKDDVIMFLNAKKAVLCEKSFCINEAEAKEMINCARKNNVFLMEAMWTRFLPITKQVNEWIDQGSIGDVRLIKATLGFESKVDPEWRLYKRELGGGALLDIGIYTTSYISMIYKQEPIEISGFANIGVTKVDEDAEVILKYEDGKMAEMSLSIKNQLNTGVYVMGTKGYIYIPDFHYASKAILKCNDKEQEEIKLPCGYEYEVMEVNKCLLDNKKESDIMTLNETLSLMKTLDRIRKPWGLTYPNDK